MIIKTIFFFKCIGVTFQISAQSIHQLLYRLYVSIQGLWWDYARASKPSLAGYAITNKIYIVANKSFTKNIQLEFKMYL